MAKKIFWKKLVSKNLKKNTLQICNRSLYNQYGGYKMADEKFDYGSIWPKIGIQEFSREHITK